MLPGLLLGTAVALCVAAPAADAASVAYTEGGDVVLSSPRRGPRGRRGGGEGQAAARSVRPVAAWEGAHAARQVDGRRWGVVRRRDDGARALSASRSARSVDQKA